MSNTEEMQVVAECANRLLTNREIAKNLAPIISEDTKFMKNWLIQGGHPGIDVESKGITIAMGQKYEKPTVKKVLDDQDSVDQWYKELGSWGRVLQYVDQVREANKKLVPVMIYKKIGESDNKKTYDKDNTIFQKFLQQ